MAQEKNRCPECNTFNPPSSRICMTCGVQLISDEVRDPDEVRAIERPGCITACVILLIVAAGLNVILSQTLFKRFFEQLSTSALNPDTVLGLSYFRGSAILFFWIASGLWRLQNWARIAIIIIQAFAIFLITALNPPSIFLQAPLSGYIIYWFTSNGHYFKKEYRAFAKEASALIVVGIITFAVYFWLLPTKAPQ